MVILFGGLLSNANMHGCSPMMYKASLQTVLAMCMSNGVVSSEHMYIPAMGRTP